MKKWLWVLPLFLSIGLYAQVLNFDLIWDDRPLFNEVLPHYQNLQDPFTLKDIYGLPAFYYRPWIMLSYMLDRSLWGEDLFGFHLTLLVVHCLAVVLAYFVSLKLVEDQKKAVPIALASAFLFASHPVHTEVVAWISGRPDGWLSVFGLASFLFFLLYRKNPEKKWIFLSWLFFLLALLSKETAMLLLPCLLLYDLLFPPEGEAFPRSLLKRRHLGYLLLVLAFLGAREYFLSKALVPYLPGGTLLGFLKRVFFLYGYYIRKVIWPFPLNAFQLDFPNIHWWVPLTFFIVTAFLLFRSIVPKEQGVRLAFYSFFFFWILLIPPVIVLLQPMQVAERYLYLPSFAFCFLVAYFLFHSPRFRILNWGLLLALVGWWSFKTVERLPVWKNEHFFWEDASRHNPERAGPLFNLAAAYYREKDVPNALLYYEKALQAPVSTPNERALVYNSIGVIHYYEGKEMEKAESMMRMALTQAPIADAFCNLGAILMQKKTPSAQTQKTILQEAVENLGQCVKTTPKNLQMWEERLKEVRRELEQL